MYERLKSTIKDANLNLKILFTVDLSIKTQMN